MGRDWCDEWTSWGFNPLDWILLSQETRALADNCCFLTAGVDIRVRVRGGGHTSQVYAIRQAIAKSIVRLSTPDHCRSERKSNMMLPIQIAYYQKFVDEHSKNQLKQALVAYDRTLLVADNRRCEPKKFGGPGARARYQKSYR